MVFVLEFKVGQSAHSNLALEQALDYSMDLKNFHEQSHSREIVPIVVAPEAPSQQLSIGKHPKHLDGVYYPIKANKDNIAHIIMEVASKSFQNEELNPNKWTDSVYKPTPTIIEAAQALYKGHNVQEISRSDSGAINLSTTSKAISEIIESSKSNNRKSICFVTGVPGAGKTLAGVNIANERQNVDEEEHAVYLSGNGPLVLSLIHI